MASLTRRKNLPRDKRQSSIYDLQFVGLDKKRKTIRLGRVTAKQAETIKARVEQIIEAKQTGSRLDSHVAEWLGGLPRETHAKLVQYGLADGRANAVLLGEFLDNFIASRPDVKPATLGSYDRARQSLLAYFSRDRPLGSITPADANAWRVWMKTEGNRRDKTNKTMAENTVRRRSGLAKQFFSEAIANRLITENPFAELNANVKGNPKRQFFVDLDTIYRCMDSAPDIQWRTIIALARFGGLRCPTEVLRLGWEDVDLAKRRMVVHASKTEHHDDGGIRIVPIFARLLPYLQEAFDLAVEGDEYVINRYRRSTQNLRTQFLKIIKRAGLKPWPRLFQNLRATRETELLNDFPMKDVCDWIGNSQAVAMAHYAMPQESSFTKALAEVVDLTRHKPTAESTARSAETVCELYGSQEPLEPATMRQTDSKALTVTAFDVSRRVVTHYDKTNQWAVMDSNQ